MLARRREAKLRNLHDRANAKNGTVLREWDGTELRDASHQDREDHDQDLHVAIVVILCVLSLLQAIADRVIKNLPQCLRVGRVVLH